MPVKRGNGKRGNSINVATHPLVQRFLVEALLSGLSIVGGEGKWKCFVIIYFFKYAVSLQADK